MTGRVIVGHCLDVLRTLPDSSVQCCVTSPPYWGLRDYGLPPTVWGGEDGCQHEWGEQTYQRRSNDGGEPDRKQPTNAGAIGRDQPIHHAFCQRCGAWRGELGLEPTPELYVEHLVAVMREVRRVLRPDGTLWLNLGDSYAGANYRGGSVESASAKQASNQGTVGFMRRTALAIPPGLKPKDLVGLPWRVALALQADGWWLRQDIIWAKAISGMIRKGSTMPESVTDRFCKSHEYVFLLTKSSRYFFDSLAVADVLDNSESHEYDGGYEHKGLQQMRRGKAAGNVQQEQPAQRWANGFLQGVHCDDAQGVGQEVQPIREVQGDSAALLELGQGASNQAGISENLCDNPGAGGEIQRGCTPASARSEIQGAHKALLPKSEGETDEGGEGSQIPPNGQGAIRKAQSRDQAQASDQSVGMHTNEIGMDGHQGTIRSSVCLLREAATASRDGSCDTAKQGRGAHSGERSPILQDMQRQEGGQATATGRDVWLISSGNYKGSHFATMPVKLAERCVLAGTSAKGRCPKCGAPWERVVERKSMVIESSPRKDALGEYGNTCTSGKRVSPPESRTVGWQPTCDCDAGEPVPCTVLDCFGGAGTTALAATENRRDFVIIELNEEYAQMAEERASGVQPRLGPYV